VIKLGIFAKTFAGTNPLPVLASARAAGYRAVQYSMACSGLGSLPLAIGEKDAEAVREASEKTGVAIAAVSATYNMIHPDLAERENGRKSFEAIAAAAQRMGTRLLTLCSGSCDAHDQWRTHPDNSSAAAWEQMCREFRLLLPIAETHDIVLGIEPELANVVSSAERARDLLDAFGGDDRIRIVFDPANLFAVATVEEQRLLMANALSLLGDSIALAHAKDRLGDGRFAPAGAGVLDYRHYLSALRRSGFNGTLVAHGVLAEDPAGIAQFLTRELAAIDNDDR
jgi:sugar phosphate isomerase/epimerase